jgi:osmotically-inducible protein OsmY
MATLAPARLLALFVVPAIGIAACNRQPAERADRLAESTALPSAGGADASADLSLETLVRARLYEERRPQGGDIEVSDANGIVTLQGDVKTSDDERNALEIARGTTGVIGVEGRLTVMPMPGTPETTARENRDAPDATTSPAWITTQIQAQYFVDSDVKPWNVDVATTSAGVVALEGVVDSPQAKSEPVRIARETVGVTAVEDRLRVRAEGTESDDDHTQDAEANDTWLTAKVRAKYFLDGRVKAFELGVTTENGVVTLTGTVDSEMAGRQAVTLARSTDGVRDVRDRIAVGSATAAAPRPSAAQDSTDRIASGIEDS